MKAWKAIILDLLEVAEMNKLLRSNFARLWKNKLFWLCMGTMLVYSIVYMLNGCRQATMDLSEYQYGLDQYYFHFSLLIGFFCTLFSSMFFGTEYSDGTIRNKIIVGHTRADIYMSSLVTTFIATLLIMTAWLVGALIAVPTLGFWKMGILHLLEYLLIAVMLVLVFSAICTVVNLLSSNKAVTVVISMLLFLGLLLFANIIYNSLSQPEMVSGVQLTVDGLEMTEPTPNPQYVTGLKRKIYDFIVDFLPTGQAVRMWLLEISNPIRMLVSSAFITVLTTVCGIVAFKRKNIK